LSFLIERNVPDPISSLHELGYVVLKKQFSSEQADAVIDCYHQFLADRGEERERFKKSNGRMMRLVNFHAVSEPLQQVFAGAEDVKSLTRTFFAGKETAIYTSLFFQEGTQQDIHRDSPLFCTFPENQFLGCWFALEETDNTNGALRVMPKGHMLSSDEYHARFSILSDFRKDDPKRGIAFAESSLWAGYQAYVQRKCAERGITEQIIEVEKGDVIVWHPMLPHGGSPILDKSRSRYSVVFHVLPVREVVYGNDLFFAPHEFTQFKDAPPFLAIPDSDVYMQANTPGFMLEG
jgi:phytanoyl-CoA hydroxylase